jgi:hypothetical protein
MQTLYRREMRGSIYGKKLMGFDPGVSCDGNDVIRFLRNLSQTHMLRKISDTDTNIDVETGLILIDEIPVNSPLLVTAAEYAVRYCNTSKHADIPERVFSTFLRMIFKIRDDQLLQINDNRFSLLVRIANRDFPRQENMLSELARCFYIYCKLWALCGTEIEARKEIEEIVGIDYHLLLLFTYAFTGSKESYFWPYEKEVLEKLEISTRLPITFGAQSKFLDWCCCNTSSARSYDGSVRVFEKYPLIRCDYKPNKSKGDVLLRISSRELHRKATKGIYYDLSERHSGSSGKNPFRTAFGAVFQEYVGVLLKEHFKSWDIQPEIEYREGKTLRRSIDWIVWKEDKAILIEVKQNALGHQAKTSGKQHLISRDVNRNIGKAIGQLERTKHEIKSQEHDEFKKFHEVSNIETMVVLYDPLYLAWTVLDECIDKVKHGSYQKHHIISICDLEHFCDSQKDTESMFDILSFKMMEQEHKLMDFREYLIKMYPNYQRHISFHVKIFDEIFSVMPEMKI